MAAQKHKKLRNNKLGVSDLTAHVQENVGPDAKVYVLKEKKWVHVGTHWILLFEVFTDDDVHIKIAVRPHIGLLTGLELFLSGMPDDGEWYRWDDNVTNTNIWLDVYFYGDGSKGIPLAAVKQSI